MLDSCGCVGADGCMVWAERHGGRTVGGGGWNMSWGLRAGDSSHQRCSDTPGEWKGHGDKHSKSKNGGWESVHMHHVLCVQSEFSNSSS